MTIQSIARTEVMTVAPDAPVADLATKMTEKEIGSLVVVEDDAPIGIVTDRDLVVEVLGKGLSADDVTARDVMHADLFTVAPDDGIFDVVSKMCEESVRRVPVVEDGELVGIVTLDDVVVLLATELSDVAGVIISESPPYEASIPTA